jgi:hypothetical protein
LKLSRHWYQVDLEAVYAGLEYFLTYHPCGIYRPVKAPVQLHAAIRVILDPLYAFLRATQLRLNAEHGGDAAREVSDVVHTASQEALHGFETLNLELRDGPLEVEHLEYPGAASVLIENGPDNVVLVAFAPASVVDVTLEVFVAEPVHLSSQGFGLR